MSVFDLIPAAVGLPGENAPIISRQVQQIALNIPIVGDHRRQNKSPLPTGISFIVSHQLLSSSPAAGLHVRQIHHVLSLLPLHCLHYIGYYPFMLVNGGPLFPRERYLSEF